MTADVEDWVAFYDSDHSIYVNARHKDVHYREIAEAIAGYVPGHQARVLDHGCGDAIHARVVAAVCEQLVLCDAAASVRAALTRRFASEPKISVLSPAEVETLPAASFDLIVANSLVQYLTPEELEGAMALWRRLLATDGTLVVADVIPPDVGAVSDLAALLRYASRNGFLLAALLGLARTATSSYRRLRNTLGVARYGETDFKERLERAGFTAQRAARNMEHNPARMTFVAKAR